MISSSRRGLEEVQTHELEPVNPVLERKYAVEQYDRILRGDLYYGDTFDDWLAALTVKAQIIDNPFLTNSTNLAQTKWETALAKFSSDHRALEQEKERIAIFIMGCYRNFKQSEHA